MIQRGTATYATEVGLLATMRAHRQTLVSIDQHLTYAVTGVHGWQVTLRVHQNAIEDHVLDQDGRVVSATPYPPEDFFFLLTSTDGRWRIADITLLSIDPTVILSPTFSP